MQTPLLLLLELKMLLHKKNVEKRSQFLCPFLKLSNLKGKFQKNQDKILEHLLQVKINPSLLHVIKQVSTYTKVINYLCAMKIMYYVKKIAF